MSDWFKFNAWMRDLSGKKHSPPEFPVIVWGVTIDTARDKLIGEYPSKDYEVVSLERSPEPAPYMSGFQVQNRFNPD